MRFDLLYTADRSDCVTRLEFRQNATATIDVDELVENLIDESYASFYYDRFTFHVGYMKTVWGTGDQIHVVDLLNSDGFSDFINPDYIDRRNAAGMFTFDVPLFRTGAIALEVAYLPVLNPDTVPESGRWAPVEVAILRDLLSRYETGVAGGVWGGAPRLEDPPGVRSDPFAVQLLRSVQGSCRGDTARIVLCSIKGIECLP